jgi:hypothetical protein
MKKIIFLIALTICSGSLFAQMADSSSIRSSAVMGGMNPTPKDCIYKSNGMLMQVKGGQSMAMTKSVTLNNGATVSANGVIKMADGTTMKLKNDESVDMDGKISTMKKPMKPVTNSDSTHHMK